MLILEHTTTRGVFMSNYKYPYAFESIFEKEFIDTIENAISNKEYINTLREFAEASVISMDSQIDPFFIIITAMQRYSGYFDESSLNLAIAQTLILADEGKIVTPEAFTMVLKIYNVINKEHHELMLKAMQEGWRSANKVLLERFLK